MIENIEKYNNRIFERIKRIDGEENEYWLARELQRVLEYIKWQKFLKVIENAKIACDQSNFNVNDHFTQVGKMINIAKGAKRKIIDYKLSRYACYLIVQNADSSKEVVALGQTYFAIQTRKQEILESGIYEKLSEDEKRIYQRNLTKKGNFSLNRTAVKSGVKNLDKFHNAGYMGLYNGETAADIAKRKNLRYREDILDNMSSDELVYNLFRISLTEQKLKRENINTGIKPNEAHFKVGKNVRNVIIENGGVAPELLPTPSMSLKELEKNKTELPK